MLLSRKAAAALCSHQAALGHSCRGRGRRNWAMELFTLRGKKRNYVKMGLCSEKRPWKKTACGGPCGYHPWCLLIPFPCSQITWFSGCVRT